MALLSDVDWVIVLVAAAFLLFGKDSSQTLRTLGRWYGRAGQLKQDLLAEFSKAAEIPTPGPGQPLSIRGALLGLDPTPSHTRGIPAAVRTPPAAPPPPVPATTSPWTGGYPTPIWTATASVDVADREAYR